MKKIVGFMALAFLPLMVACSSMAPTETRQWQPTAVTEFKSVAGKWEGPLIQHGVGEGEFWHFDRVTIVIGDTGAYEFDVLKTHTTAEGGVLEYHTEGEYVWKGKSVLTDGKLSATGEKGGQMTLQLYVDPGSSERMLKADIKDSKGFIYFADLKRTGDSGSAK